MQQQEGWTQVVRKSCVFCRWHTSELIKSGRDPIREHCCTHPSWHTQNSQHALSNDEEGRFIGRSDNTPYWCPVSQAKTKPPVLTQGV